MGGASMDPLRTTPAELDLPRPSSCFSGRLRANIRQVFRPPTTADNSQPPTIPLTPPLRAGRITAFTL
jgi:hypothetical protein